MNKIKHIDEINVEKRVHSPKNNKWMLRGRDKKTKQLGILVCIEANGELIPHGKWLELE